MTDMAANERSKTLGSHATLFVVAAVVLCVVIAAFVVAITISRPTADNTSLITTVTAILAPAVLALLGAAIQQVHLAVNSRLSQLLEMTAAAHLAEGKLAALQPTPHPPRRTDLVATVVIDPTRPSGDEPA